MKKYFYADALQSARISTRFLTLNDKEKWKEFFKDAESVEFFPNTDNEDPETRAAGWLEKQLIRYSENKYGLQALTEKNGGKFIGQCGLLLQEVNGKEELEVGYHIFKEDRGKGFAPEAAKMFLKFGFENDLADSIISIIHRDNVKSQSVARKNGLKLDFETNWRDIPVFIYRITKEEFLRRK